jgi:hypothetical protein
LLIAYWHVVHGQVDYADLGPDWAQCRRSTEHRTRRLVHQLEQLGNTVTLEPSGWPTGLRPELRTGGHLIHTSAS